MVIEISKMIQKYTLIGGIENTPLRRGEDPAQS